MEKLKCYIKREMDVDYLACVHGMSIIFMYGLLLYFTGNKDISYEIIFQIFVVGYVISWTQKLLFLKERVYKNTEFKIRAVMWCVLPNIECFITARLFHWYEGMETWIEPVFYLVMLSYYIMVFWSVRTFYKEETYEMNQLLSDFKRRELEYERNHQN